MSAGQVSCATCPLAAGARTISRPAAPAADDTAADVSAGAPPRARSRASATAEDAGSAIAVALVGRAPLGLDRANAELADVRRRRVGRDVQPVAQNRLER